MSKRLAAAGLVLAACVIVLAWVFTEDGMLDREATEEAIRYVAEQPGWGKTSEVSLEDVAESEARGPTGCVIFQSTEQERVGVALRERQGKWEGWFVESIGPDAACADIFKRASLRATDLRP